jgi:hypothetical protein
MTIYEGTRIMQLLEIIERNRWDILKRRTNDANPTVLEDENSDDVIVEDVSAKDVQIVLYAAPSPFTDSLVIMFSKETVIASFDEPEKTITFCFDNQTKFLMMDLDPPSDSHLILDVFSAIKILKPDTTFFAFTKRVNSPEKDYLHKNGVVIIEKPVFKKQVNDIVRQYIKAKN